MAHAATLRKMMQSLRSINNDMDKFEASSLRIDSKLSSYFDHTTESQANHDIIALLKEEKIKLHSITAEFNSNHFHSNTNTPNTRFSKSKPKYSKKKPRPTVKRTPLKVSTTAISNIQNTITNTTKSDNICQNLPLNRKYASNPPNVLDKKIPQKKTLLSLSSKPFTKSSTAMLIDTDSENDENLAPLNLSVSSRTMVQMKMEHQIRKKQQKKQKPKVDALERAKEKRRHDEQKERERERKRELKRAQIAENKRKQKLLEQQKLRSQQHNKNTKTKKYNNKKAINGRKSKVNHPRMVKKMPNIKKIAFKMPQNTIKQKQNMKPMLIKNKVNVNKEYQLSDYDSNYSDSDLDEESCGKFIPLWAKKRAPLQAVKRQKAIDPDTIFGRMHYKSVDLEVVFKDWPSKTKYRNRSASGDWSKDQISWTEENGYKKNMGWCK